MPLPAADDRKEIHTRQITMKAWRRFDGLFDVESHLMDTKPFVFQRLIGGPLQAGLPLHDLWVRVVVDSGYVERDITASSDVTPFAVCRAATETLSVMIGERIGRGWSKKVREKLGGVASCTHLAELLVPLATTALQGIQEECPQQLEQIGPDGRSRHIDSCYAFAAEGM